MKFNNNYRNNNKNNDQNNNQNNDHNVFNDNVIEYSSYYLIHKKKAIYFNREGDILDIVKLLPEEKALKSKSSIRLNNKLDSVYTGSAYATEIIASGSKKIVYYNKNGFKLFHTSYLLICTVELFWVRSLIQISSPDRGEKRLDWDQGSCT